MNRNKTTTYFLAIIVLSLTISLTLLGCSSWTTSSSNSEKVSSDSSSSTTQLTIDTVNPKPDLAKVYSQAIGDYIRFVNKEYNLTFDTLFFGKYKFGQADDFPDIELPAIIENTSIKLISPEQGTKIQTVFKSSFYINLIGWVNSDNAEFIFVTFSNGLAHQFDCFIKYNYNTKKQTYEVDNSRFENFQYKDK
ncbi:hypothetical protein [Flavobacterium filum]|uniref:hypothetical protein n=1 Tax=Flavobacterium filum TaxID=370974 RepID=UPI0023F53AAA|nr:hypothetical protein [Flavobacterium filum]